VRIVRDAIGRRVDSRQRTDILYPIAELVAFPNFHEWVRSPARGEDRGGTGNRPGTTGSLARPLWKSKIGTVHHSVLWYTSMISSEKIL
jgi:hypothetical protein